MRNLNRLTGAFTGHRLAARRTPSLDNARLNALGLNRMRLWRNGLADYLLEKHGSTGVDAEGIHVHSKSRVE